MHSNAILVAVAALLPAVAVFAAPVNEKRAFDASDPRFTMFDLPTPLTGPCDLEHGPDGALWGQGILYNTFFRIDPDTGHVDEYPIPFTTPLDATVIELPGILKSVTDRTALSCAIRKGEDGMLYAGNGIRNQLVRINPTTKKIDIYELTGPLGNLFNFNDLYTAKDGIWVTATTGNTFSFFSFETEKFTTYDVPTPVALPLGLYVASNGIVYVAELVANKILKFDPKTKVITEHPLPELAQFPAVIRAERDGHVYFSLFVGNGVGRINMETDEIDLYHTNQTLLLGSEDTIDKYGGVWISSFTSDVMSRLDTNTFEFSYVALPPSLAQAGLPGVLGDIPPYVDIAVNYGPGDAIWFTSLLTNQVGRYEITGLYK
jgi:streptogramin lyase